MEVGTVARSSEAAGMPEQLEASENRIPDATLFSQASSNPVSIKFGNGLDQFRTLQILCLRARTHLQAEMFLRARMSAPQPHLLAQSLSEAVW